jgi:uncharacterized membrane protein
MQTQPCAADVAPAIAQPAESPAAVAVFDAVITPHVSLGVRGLFTLMLFSGGLVTATAIFFAWAGLWPSSLFVLISGALLIAALIACRRDLRRAERVLVAGGTITVERFDGHRRIARQGCFPLFGLSIERRVDPDHGCIGLYLRHRAERLEIARDLPPAERSRFLAALSDALAAAGAKPALHTTTTPALFAAGAEHRW